MSTSAQRRPTPGRSSALLLVLSGNMLIDSLEVSTMLVAMPVTARAMHVTAVTGSGFMISFAVGFGGFVAVSQRVTARFGRRRVYLGSLVAFVIASLAAGFAVNPAMLDAARIVKGACVALTAPTGLAIIAATFPEGPPRQRAISVYSMFGASGFSAGLLVAGALTCLDWRLALLFSGAAALALFPSALGHVPADQPPGRATARVAADVTAGPPAPGSAPPVRPVRSPRSSLVRSALGAAALNGPYWGFLFLATYDLQGRARWTPLETGLALLPSSLPLALTARRSASLARRLGTGRLIVLGSLAALAGYAWYLRSGPRPAYLTGLLPATLLVGAAFMLSFTALHMQATTGVPASCRGAVAAFYQACVQLGGAAVLALTATVAALDGHLPALATVAGCAGAGTLTALTGLIPGRAPRAPASRTA
jgi:MFS family permease